MIPQVFFFSKQKGSQGIHTVGHRKVFFSFFLLVFKLKKKKVVDREGLWSMSSQLPSQLHFFTCPFSFLFFFVVVLLFKKVAAIKISSEKKSLFLQLIYSTAAARLYRYRIGHFSDEGCLYFFFFLFVERARHFQLEKNRTECQS